MWRRLNDNLLGNHDFLDTSGIVPGLGGEMNIIDYPRCKTCKWYHPNESICSVRCCDCPKMIYSYDACIKPDPDGLCVENDEGWGMLPSPEFGCIHHEIKTLMEDEGWIRK